MHWFFLAMRLYPDVQSRARRELEAVLGTYRLPTFEDFGSVPYIDALIKELLRWQPILRLGTSGRGAQRADAYSLLLSAWIRRSPSSAAGGRHVQRLPLEEGLPCHRQHLVSMSMTRSFGTDSNA